MNVEHIPTKDGQARVLRRRGPGPTLVLVHGCGGNERTFDFVLPHLGELDVVVPALPGRPGSTGPVLENAAEAGRWILELARGMHLGPFVLAGYSYGGALAIEAALLASAETNEKTPSFALVGLALVSSGARLRVHPQILQMADEAARAGAPMLFGEASYEPETPKARREAAEVIAARTPPEAARGDWRACDGFDRMKELGRIRAPMLVVSGDRDALTPPKYAAFVAATIPGTRVVTVSGGGHALPVDKPEEVGRALVRFVTDIAENEVAARPR